MFCTKCGKEQETGVRFCSACGAQVAKPSSPISPRPFEPSPAAFTPLDHNPPISVTLPFNPEEIRVLKKRLERKRMIAFIAPFTSFFLIIVVGWLFYLLRTVFGDHSNNYAGSVIDTIASVFSALVPVLISIIVLCIPFGIAMGISYSYQIRELKKPTLPYGVVGWNWGACLLSFIWGIRFRVWIALLALIPYAGVIMTLVLGVKGSEWAWKKGHWETVEAFQESRRRWNIASLVLLVGITVISIFSVFLFWGAERNATTNTAITPSSAEPVKMTRAESQEKYGTPPILADRNIPLSDIKRSVVNIICESSLDGELSGGSGTLISSDGIILTANHIFPQDADNIYITSDGCLVTIPDEITGAPAEMYWAKPAILSGISDLYDMAFLQISNAYTDESGIPHGQYPNTFYSFMDTQKYKEVCESNKYLNTQLGDRIKILGYPTTSGGIALTITEGVISAISEDGRLLTSAKIDSGNSGGIAVSELGCMVGMPIAVMEGDHEKLGQIISGDEIVKFFNVVNAHLQ